MLNITGSGGRPPEGLEELLRLTIKEPKVNVSVPGDISTLAERAAERIQRKSFKPGDFVQIRVPEGLGIRHSGPYVVIRTLEKPVLVHEHSSEWESNTFSHAESDMIVGMIMRTGPEGDSAYREVYTWSGLLTAYDLDADGVRMAEIGREAVNQGRKVSREEDAEENRDDADRSRVPGAANASVSPWRGTSDTA